MIEGSALATLAAGVLAAIGAVLVIAGIRGRLVHAHPVCRKCKFDLSASGNSQVCPECGANLAERRSMRSGLRAKRRGVLAIGLLLLGVSAVLAGLIGYQRAAGADWNRYKPTWLLMMETDSGDSAHLDNILAELLNRYRAGELGDGTIASLVADGLARQGDPNAAWPNNWSGLIEAAILDGRLTDEQAQTYFRQGIDATITHRALGTPGGRLPVRIEITEPRVHNSMTASNFLLKRALTSVRMGEAELKDGGGYSAGSMSAGGTTSSTTHVELSDAIGVHELQIVFELAVFRSGDDVRAGVPLVAWTETLQSQLELRADVSDAVRFVVKEELREAVASAIHIEQLRVRAFGRQPRLTARIRIDDPPHDVAFDIFLRQGDREWTIGRAATAAGSSDAVLIHQRLPGATTGAASLVFRPSAAAALEKIGLDEVWGEDVVIEDDSLEWVDAGAG